MRLSTRLLVANKGECISLSQGFHNEDTHTVFTTMVLISGHKLEFRCSWSLIRALAGWAEEIPTESKPELQNQQEVQARYYRKLMQTLANFTMLVHTGSFLVKGSSSSELLPPFQNNCVFFSYSKVWDISFDGYGS